jgi:flagellar basal body rod protein FlgG
VNSVAAGQLSVVDFGDYGALLTEGKGVYNANGQTPIATDATIEWKTLERANADAAEEMTDAMASQRNLQACAQALQMFM